MYRKRIVRSLRNSAATISRYRSGERVPEAETENLKNLVHGIVRIAEKKNRTDLTIRSVSDSFAPCVRSGTINVANLQENFNTLLTALHVSISELSRFLIFDAFLMFPAYETDKGSLPIRMIAAASAVLSPAVIQMKHSGTSSQN